MGIWCESGCWHWCAVYIIALGGANNLVCTVCAKGWVFCCPDKWCYCPVMRCSRGWRSFTAGSKQDGMWFLKVTPPFPFSGEVRPWKTQPVELLFSHLEQCIQKKKQSKLSIAIQITGEIARLGNNIIFRPIAVESRMPLKVSLEDGSFLCIMVFFLVCLNNILMHSWTWKA